MVREFADVQEVAQAKGARLGPTDWLTIDQSRIDLFADATSDHQWIHVDHEKAAAGPFGTTIAHGYLSLSLLAHFSPQLIKVAKPPKMSINYGLNKVRFLQPVASGSRVRDVAELSEVKESEKGLLLTVTHTVEIEGEERPALVAESLGLWVP
ncbi:MaoC family dehydratase [Nocardiopsis coralli]|uniref:MaoC family dehydratase n=1 Tax=Nocardiopsis coralli TaxID=2772213 RepID=UPI002E295CE6|nr:MaoC family dehydratase [Nocardiopsis coralli]